MKVFKRKMLFIIIYTVLYVSIVSIAIINVLNLNFILSILCMLGFTGFILYMTISQKIKVDTEKIYIIKLGSYSNAYWEDIKEVKYIKSKVYIYNEDRTFIGSIDRFYENYKKLWLEIYEKTKVKSTNCKYDDYFRKIVDSIKE